MSIIAFANQKGGVGKTTTAVNLATALASIDKKVLLIDLDPQGNASTGLGIKNDQRANNTYHILHDPHSIAKTISKTLVPNLMLIPAHEQLAAIDHELSHQTDRYTRLKTALVSVKAQYDFIFIDCPPSLGTLTLNALTCCNRVLVPLQCEFYALEGLSQLLKSIMQIKTKINPSLDLQGVVLTMYQKRSVLNQQVALDAQKHLGKKVYKTRVPRNIRLSEAPSFGQPAIVYDLQCPGSQAYIELAKEFIARELAS